LRRHLREHEPFSNRRQPVRWSALGIVHGRGVHSSTMLPSLSRR
jgi:hypothetical protein